MGAQRRDNVARDRDAAHRYRGRTAGDRSPAPLSAQEAAAPIASSRIAGTSRTNAKSTSCPSSSPWRRKPAPALDEFVERRPAAAPGERPAGEHRGYRSVTVRHGDRPLRRERALSGFEQWRAWRGLGRHLPVVHRERQDPDGRRLPRYGAVRRPVCGEPGSDRRVRNVPGGRGRAARAARRHQRRGELASGRRRVEIQKIPRDLARL